MSVNCITALNIHLTVEQQLYLVFRPYRWKAISPIDVTVPWSVYLSVTFVHCAQMAEDIDM